MLSCDKRVSEGSSPCIHYIKNDTPGEAGFCKLPSIFRCTEALKHLSVRMSHSTIQDYLTCKMLFYYKHILGLSPRNHMLSGALKMGRYWDLLQGVFYGVHTIDYVYSEMESYAISPLDMARVEGVYDAMVEFIEPNTDGLVGLQQHFHIHNYHSSYGDVIIHGYYDRLYEDYFAESKFTSKPSDYVTVPFRVASQIGTYFLADEKLKKVVMEVVKKPDLRPKQDEDPATFKQRVTDDVMRRPSNYFIGLNRSERRFGKVFLRSEFDLAAIERRYAIVIGEIKRIQNDGEYYPNERSCERYNTQCEFVVACECGGRVDMNSYQMREKE
jgi:hypothetical protein